MIERREAHNDQRDRATIAHAQRAGWLSPTLRYAFLRPNDEPLLWIPDAVAGLVAAALADPRRGQIRSVGRVRLVEVDP